jgi:SIR2-like domain/HEAT repeats
MSSPIAFLLGAGASQPYGVPTMVGFYAAFRDHLAKRHPKHFVLLEQLERGNSGARYDLETLLSDLQLALSAGASLKLLGVSIDPSQLSASELAELRGFLDAFIVDTCERFDRDRSAVELGPLLKLRTLGPLWVFTTNYDRIVEQACEQNGVEFADGFQADIGNPVADYTGVFDVGVRIVKLHGSVNWYQDNPDGKLHRLDRGYSLPSKDFALVREGQRLTPLMIIPTLEKQVLERPYAQLAVRLTDVLRDLPLLIVAGNSLRDKHLLNYISDRLPRLQVLLLSPNASRSLSRLGMGAGVQALDVGFRELLTTSSVALETLGRQVQAAQTPDAVGAAVRDFTAEVTANTKASDAMQANPELAVYDRMLRDESVAQRARAADALGAFAHPGVVHRLTEVLKSDPSESVRAAATSALIRVGTPNAIEAAFVGLRDSSKTVQLEAVTGLLTRLPDAAVTAALEQAKAGLSTAAQQILEHETASVAKTAPPQ